MRVYMLLSRCWVKRMDLFLLLLCFVDILVEEALPLLAILKERKRLSHFSSRLRTICPRTSMQAAKLKLALAAESGLRDGCHNLER